MSSLEQLLGEETVREGLLYARKMTKRSFVIGKFCSERRR